MKPRTTKKGKGTNFLKRNASRSPTPTRGASPRPEDGVSAFSTTPRNASTKPNVTQVERAVSRIGKGVSPRGESPRGLSPVTLPMPMKPLTDKSPSVHQIEATQISSPTMQIDYGLVQTPPKKQTIFTGEVQNKLAKAEMATFKKFTPFSESQAHSEHPFDLAISEASRPSAIKKSEAIGQQQQRPKRSLGKFAQDLQPFKNNGSTPGKISDVTPKQQKFSISQLKVEKPKPRETEKCKECAKPTFMNSVCNSCDLQSFDIALRLASKKSSATESKMTERTPDNDSAPSLTKFIDVNGATPSQSYGSIQKPAFQSPISLMPLSIAEEENDHNSSAGGGDRMDTSKNSAGAYGAGVSHQGSRPSEILRPSDARQSDARPYAVRGEKPQQPSAARPSHMTRPSEDRRIDFIFEQQSDSGENRESIKIKDSLPQFLRTISNRNSFPSAQDAEEESLSAVKNISRYGDDESVSRGTFIGDNNMDKGAPRVKLHLKIIQIDSINDSGRDESMGLRPSEREMLRKHQSHRNIKLAGEKLSGGANQLKRQGGAGGGGPQEAENITPYSFADGLILTHSQKQSPAMQSEQNKSVKTNGNNILLDEDSNPHISKVNGLQQSSANHPIKSNPFGVQDDDEQFEIGVTNRATCNFGSMKPIQGGSKRPSYYKSHDQEQCSPTQTRQLSTETPLETNRLDSARNRLLSLHNDNDAYQNQLILESNSTQKAIQSQASQRLGSSKNLYHKSTSKGSTLETNLRVSTRVFQEEDENGFVFHQMPLEGPKLGRRLTITQIDTLANRYQKWRESLPWCKRLQQQQGEHYQFSPTFSKSICFFSILTLMFSFLGLLFYFSANKLNNMVLDYGELCESQGRLCEITFTPETDFIKPHLYYELDEFYSNYRNLVTTGPLFSQLRGESIDTDKCQGVSTVADLLPDLSVYQQFATQNLTELASDTPLNPCGLLPKYVFSDTFKLEEKLIDDIDEDYEEIVEIPIDEKNIASMQDILFKFEETSSDEFQWLDVTNEHFIVWHQMDTLNRVFRLYGRIDDDLKKDHIYVLKIDNSYDKAIFHGKKRLHFEEVNQLGGSNNWLGVIFFCTAATLVVIQMAFVCLYIAKIQSVDHGAESFYDPDKLHF